MSATFHDEELVDDEFNVMLNPDYAKFLRGLNACGRGFGDPAEIAHLYTERVASSSGV